MKIEQVTKVTDEMVTALRKLIWQLDSSRPKLTKTELQKICSYPSTSLFIARDLNNEIIGTVTLTFSRHPTGYMANIEDFVVETKARNMGIGSLLIKFALNKARSKGVSYVHLTSRPERVVANKLYKKVGFQIRETNVYRYKYPNT